MSFGQHQSFYLREKWLSKGIKELNIDANFFKNNRNFEIIGLGKNMVSSLKFWMGATKVIEEYQTNIRISPLGESIYRNDKFIKNNFTKFLLHYFLASNNDEKENAKYCSTVIYWFYNIYNETVFNKETLSDDFVRWVETKYPNRSRKSLERDISMLLQLYTVHDVLDDPEEVAISPLSSLNLVKRFDKRYVKSEVNENDLPCEIIMVYLINYKDTHDNFITIDHILKEDKGIGKILNMTRSSLISKIDELANEQDERFKIDFTRTNNLDTINIPKNANLVDYINTVYERMSN